MGKTRGGRPNLPQAAYRALVTALEIVCDHRCENPWCRSKAFLDPHHVVKRSQGGLDTPDNLVMLCRICHDNTDRPVDHQFWLGVEVQGEQTFNFSKRFWLIPTAFDVRGTWETTILRYQRRRPTSAT